jgi:hypothetical protein
VPYIVAAGKQSKERPTLFRDVVANRATQIRIQCRWCIEFASLTPVLVLKVDKRFVASVQRCSIFELLVIKCDPFETSLLEDLPKCWTEFTRLVLAPLKERLALVALSTSLMAEPMGEMQISTTRVK